ncbi:MAG: hypothetical protein RIR73_2405, partial [Chloroflexota bacterium]
KKWRVLIGVIIVVLTVLLGTGFYYTGGIGLVRLYRNYLSQDIADKKYSWQDFRDRGATEKLSGYYAGRLGDKIYIWTLSGLKSFGYEEGQSVYYYMDVCGVVRQLAAERVKNQSASSENGEKIQYNDRVFFDPSDWDVQAKRGDYVAVVRTVEEPGIVSQLYGSSNQYFPLTELRDELCAE